jgi:hypothetical protein
MSAQIDIYLTYAPKMKIVTIVGQFEAVYMVRKAPILSNYEFRRQNPYFRHTNKLAGISGRDG